MTAAIWQLRDARSWHGAAQAAARLWRADSLRGRFARGAVWSLAATVISQGSNLASSMIAARLLGREQFGAYGMIQSTAGMLGIFAGLGLGLTATKYVAEFRSLDPPRAGRMIALGSTVATISGTLLALSLALFAPLLAAKTMQAPGLAMELRIASVLLFLNALNGAQTGALSGFEAFRTIAWINLGRALIALPVTFAAVRLWHLPGAVAALALVAGTACLMSHIALRRECDIRQIHPSAKTCWSEARVLWTYSTPAFLSGATAGPALWAANALLVQQPGGFGELGVFSAANQWRNAISFIPTVLAQFALPLLSNLNGEKDVRYGKVLRWNLALTVIVAVAVALPIAGLAPHIMRIYGNEFEQGTTLLVLSAATAVVSSVNTVVGTAILSAGSVWTGFAFNGLWAVVLLAGCRYLVPSGLALGLAQSMLAAYTAHTLWQGVYLRYRLFRPRENRP